MSTGYFELEDVEGESANSKFITTFTNEPSFDQEYTEKVYTELAGHVQEGSKDGELNVRYYGAFSDLEFVLGKVLELYRKTVTKNSNDSLQIKIHKSCANEENSPVVVYTFTLVYPTKDSLLSKLRKTAGMKKISYVTARTEKPSRAFAEDLTKIVNNKFRTFASEYLPEIINLVK